MFSIPFPPPPVENLVLRYSSHKLYDVESSRLRLPDSQSLLQLQSLPNFWLAIPQLVDAPPNIFLCPLHQVLLMQRKQRVRNGTKQYETELPPGISEACRDNRAVNWGRKVQHKGGHHLPAGRSCSECLQPVSRKQVAHEGRVMPR